MRTHLVRVICLGTLLFSPIAACAGPAEDQVGASFAAWNAAFDKGDAKSIATFYTADTVFMPATHDIIRTPADVEKFFAGLFANKVTGHKLEVITVIQAGDSLIAASKWSAQGHDDKGNPATVGGLATQVLQKQSDGSYKLKLHSFN